MHREIADRTPLLLILGRLMLSRMLATGRLRMTRRASQRDHSARMNRDNDPEPDKLENEQEKMKWPPAKHGINPQNVIRGFA